MTDIMRRAIHESAHAVVAAVRGLALRRVSIKAWGDSGGDCRLAEPYRDETIRDVLVFYLAGGAADWKVSGEASRSDRDDLHHARLLASVLAEADETAPATARVLARHALYASVEVQKHWRWIERVAKALARERELTAAEILELRWNPVQEEP